MDPVVFFSASPPELQLFPYTGNVCRWEVATIGMDDDPEAGRAARRAMTAAMHSPSGKTREAIRHDALPP
jgi:hypothetical protein